MAEATTRIQRSTSSTIGSLLGGLVAAALSALLFWQFVEGPITLGFALIPAIIALVLFWTAISGSATAPCPGCGALVAGLSTGANDGVLCAGCKRFLEGTAGELRVTDEQRVADSPLFGTPLPESFGWPEGCCLCARPATRRETVSISMPSAAAAGKNLAVDAVTGDALTSTGGGTRYTVEVPHCAEHQHGAELGSHPHGVKIRFRSYPFLRAFCALNKTEPG